MRQLLNGKHPMNLGEPCTVPAAMYTNLVDFVQESTKTIDLMDPGETEYGWVTVAARMHVESDMQRPPNGRGTSATHGEPKRPRRPMSRNAHDRSRASPPLHKVTATARQPR